MKPTQTRRPKPLTVSGVGTGSQVCIHDCTLPIALENDIGEIIDATFTTATVNEADLPALLGLKTLIEQRAIIDFATMKMHFSGPGESQIQLGPGSNTFQLSQAATGHLMLPCCNYNGGKRVADDSSGLALAASSGDAPSQSSDEPPALS